MLTFDLDQIEGPFTFDGAAAEDYYADKSHESREMMLCAHSEQALARLLAGDIQHAHESLDAAWAIARLMSNRPRQHGYEEDGLHRRNVTRLELAEIAPITTAK